MIILFVFVKKAKISNKILKICLLSKKPYPLNSYIKKTNSNS